MKTEIKLFCGTQNFTLLIHINLNVAATMKEFEDAYSENLVKPCFSWTVVLHVVYKLLQIWIALKEQKILT